MAKKPRSVSLSFVLLRFGIVMLGCMLLCCLLWYGLFFRLVKTGFFYNSYTSTRQIEQMLAGDPETFVSPGDNFLADYALFDQSGKVLESNTKGMKLKKLTGLLHEDASAMRVSRHTYGDGSTVIIRYYYRSEFANPVLRRSLPPFQYMWLAALGAALGLCLLFNTLWLRKRLAAKLKLFGEVSRKVGEQELDFTIPHAGIREYDQALDAMEHMRDALYNSLSSQWAAQQEREAEIAALAHDLKTPLTLVGGNAELLLDEELPESSRRMVETIAASNERARQYVTSFLEASAGEEEAFKSNSLSELFDQLISNTTAIAEARGVCMKVQNDLNGSANIQKDHLLRALGNVVQNAIEHSPVGGNVYLTGSMADGGWQVTVCDEGPGFSKAALQHATERLWRGDTARGADGHNGLGLWFAAQVVKTHEGQLYLSNTKSGGVVTINF